MSVHLNTIMYMIAQKTLLIKLLLHKNEGELRGVNFLKLLGPIFFLNISASDVNNE